MENSVKLPVTFSLRKVKGPVGPWHKELPKRNAKTAGLSLKIGLLSEGIIDGSLGRLLGFLILNLLYMK